MRLSIARPAVLAWLPACLLAGLLLRLQQDTAQRFSGVKSHSKSYCDNRCRFDCITTYRHCNNSSMSAWRSVGTSFEDCMVQDPSYDPYGYAKVATRAASAEGGAAAACAGKHVLCSSQCTGPVLPVRMCLCHSIPEHANNHKCAAAENVQKFFQAIFSLAKTADGLAQINEGMNLCRDSMVTTHDQVNASLASYVQSQWVSGVSSTYCAHATSQNCILCL